MMNRKPVPAWARIGLSRWIAASLLAAVLVTAVLVAALVERYALQQAERHAAQSLTQVAWQMRDQLDRGMAARYKDMLLLAGQETLVESADPAAIRALLERVKLNFPDYAWLGYCRPDGTVVAALSGLLEGQNVSARPWFSGAGKGPYVGDVHPAVLLEKLLPRQQEPWRFVDIAVPVRRGGEVQAILGAHLSWEWARELRRDLLSPTSEVYRIEVFIVRKDGQVLLGPPGFEGRTLQQPGLRAARAGQAADGMETWGSDGEFATAYVPTRGHAGYPGLGWTVVVRQPVSVALADFHQLRREIALASGAACLLALLLAPLVGRRLARPLTRLTRSLGRRAGEALPRIEPAGGYREAALLSDALLEMRDSVARHAEQLQALNESLERRVAERTAELAQREEDLRAIIEHAREAFIRMDPKGCVLEWNRHAEELFGWSRTEVIGRELAELIIPPAMRERHRRGMARFLSSGEGAIINQRIEVPALRRDGREMLVELVVGVTRLGPHLSFNAFLHNIEERRRAEQALRDSRETLRAVADNLPALVALVDTELRYRFTNRTYQDWYGEAPEALIGKHMSELLGQDMVARLQPQIDRALAGERVVFEAEGRAGHEQRHLHVTFVPQQGEGGQVLGFFLVVLDITERKQRELSLAQQARHDALTGLPNRRFLMELLPQAMARCGRTGAPLALLFLDLNGFKEVNDAHGHQAGDLLLKEVAQRLRAVLRKGDTVARLAGDEFVILLEPVPGGRHSAQQVVEKVHAALREPVALAPGVQVAVSASVGLSVYQPGDASTPEKLLSGADAAMYADKRASRAARDSGFGATLV
ncbi:sensor domain-containing diguanylate cyclase [Eleftheria terrae]|uniref:sensor domain-containing diguanylate cyclase n=1 Tax=Eleftheria terrae TaxID=1597781 RepID=UPI00263BC780|nr:diguanylate cyclase [Eleftheria terrae]WKB53284.1 diguanylate cyclase [Eleftheria terrae]